MSTETSRQHLKKYFHDRFVLLMLTINIFLTFVAVAIILLRLGDTGNSYIQAYRSNLGFNQYQAGGVEQIISFAVFAVAVLVGQFVISLRFHSIRRHVSWSVMMLATLLLVLTLIISNSLLQLR
ncbi:MAG: hypothetical protein ACR2FM_04635 [Candidatus Saccharimonadales bacterium]